MGHQPATTSIPPNRTKAQGSLSALYDRYAPALLGVILDIVGDQAEALTVLEHTFTQFYAQLNQEKPSKMPVFVQLLTLARSLATEARKRLAPGPATALQLTGTGKVIPLRTLNPSAEKADSSSSKENNPIWKTLLDAVLFKNCTPEEAAASLGIPADMARQQLRLAMQQLRAKRS